MELGRLACLDLLGLPSLPLRIVGETAGAAEAVKANHHVRDTIEHVAVVGDEHQRAAIFQQAFFQDLEGWDVEIVGGLVEQEHVGRLQHQPGNQDAGTFASGEVRHRLVELVPAEQKSRRPRGDMDDAVLVDH